MVYTVISCSDNAIPHAGYSSVQEYIERTNMNENGTWGSDIEIITLSHLINTCIFTYSTQDQNWCKFSPHSVDRTLPDDITRRAMYLRYLPGHYDVVLRTLLGRHGSASLYVGLNGKTRWRLHTMY